MRHLRFVVAAAALVFASVSLLGTGESAAFAPVKGHACRLGGANTLAAVECAHIRAVPSLQPAATKRLWQALVRRRRVFSVTATADCRPLRAVFYTATDWMRLATKLAANASPCAQYYFSIPSLAADHTELRSDQAWRIRALGANFHAMAEISMSAWGTWVSDNGSSWYQAGVEARRRMAATGYDVTLGDTWAVNEFSSSVRRGDGTARVDARDFVRGLFDGDGTLPKTKGTVFIVGMGQGTSDLSMYKTNLEGWLQDGAFWTDQCVAAGCTLPWWPQAFE